MPVLGHESAVPLAPELVAALEARGVIAFDEVSLRLALEQRVPGYNLD